MIEKKLIELEKRIEFLEKKLLLDLGIDRNKYSTDNIYAFNKIIEILKEKNYKIFNKHYELNIVGVRDMKTHKLNKFEESIFIFWIDTTKSTTDWQFRRYTITTLPGNRALLNFSNRNGVAMLVPNQYENVYALDLHNGKYKALCQRLGSVEVYRDKNKDLVLNMDENTITSARGINIHRANSSIVSLFVENWSEGCQVFANPTEFAQFIWLCEQHEKFNKNVFTYTLIDITNK